MMMERMTTMRNSILLKLFTSRSNSPTYNEKDMCENKTKYEGTLRDVTQVDVKKHCPPKSQYTRVTDVKESESDEKMIYSEHLLI